MLTTYRSTLKQLCWLTALLSGSAPAAVTIAVAPSTLELLAVAGSIAPMTSSITVTVGGMAEPTQCTGTIRLATYTAPWLKIGMTSPSVKSNGKIEVPLSASVSGLTVGKYQGFILISTEAATCPLAPSPFSVGVNLTITPRPDASESQAVPYLLTTVAGAVPAGDGGPATQALLIHPSAVAMDSTGAIYIAETDSHRIRRVAPDGTISTFGGSGGSGFSGDGGPATTAQIATPRGLALDQAGNLYVSSGQRVRRISVAGTITTVAGTGSFGYNGDGQAATAATLNGPLGLATDSGGNLYIAEQGGRRIRKVSPNGQISTVIADSSSSQLIAPAALAFDGSGNLYIGDLSSVRRLSATGSFSTIGGGTFGYSGDGGPAFGAGLQYIYGIAADNSGNVWVADSGNSRVRKISGGIITTVAGSASTGFGGDGGPATNGKLGYPVGLAFDRVGNLLIADQDNHAIRKLGPDGTLSTVVGGGQFASDGGLASVAALTFPNALLFDKGGNLYIADSGEHRIRKISASGIISTVAGSGAHGFSGDNGSALAAQLDSPGGIAVDINGNLYIADTNNHRVRMVAPSGTIRTVAGNGRAGFGGDSGSAIAAQLSSPAAVAIDSHGVVYIADTGNRRIRKISTDGTISTAAGDGTFGNTTSVNNVLALAVDAADKLYYSSAGRIWATDLTGAVSTVAGGGTSLADGGPATSAALLYPSGLIFDAKGNLYISDAFNPGAAATSTIGQRIRMITPTGTITTIAGTGVAGFNGDSGLSTSVQLSSPSGVAVDSFGAIYVADQANHRIRKLTADSGIQLKLSSGNAQSGIVGSILPAPVVVQLTSGSGSGLANTPVTFAVLSGDATLTSALATTGADGKAGTTVTLGTTPGPVTLTATVAGLPTVTITALATANLAAQAPRISAGGVVGAGLSIPVVSQISPNGVITIYGQNFTGAGSPLRTADLVSGRVPTALAGVCVDIGSKPAPILLVSPNQLNVQVPTLTGSGSVPIRVKVNCGQPTEVVSLPETVALQPTAPKFFSFIRNADGKNPVAAINALNGVNVGAPGLISGATFVPAQSGDIITLFLTGLGTTSPSVDAGQLPDSIAVIAAPVRVQIGQAVLADSDVLYAGVAPGYAGLYQINIRMPALPAGDMPIRVTAGISSTPTGSYVSVRDQ